MSDNNLQQLYIKANGQLPVRTEALPISGSARRYYRMTDASGNSVLGACNADLRENRTFLYMTRHFLEKGLPVPQIICESEDLSCYLLQDLGDGTLLHFIENHSFSDTVNTEVRNVYRDAIQMLQAFQIRGKEGFDFSAGYPRSAFDRQSMMWDLNYFKYHFLKLMGIPFEEQLLEDDFSTLCSFLLEADCNYFLYRDFQSRNIMIYRDKLYGIDYQGGRKGALQYDLASLLFEAKTHLPSDFREEMLFYYIETLAQHYPVQESTFVHYFYGYVYIRMMQAMGAYGFRGLYEKKPLFIQSIPYGVQILGWLNQKVSLPVKLPELTRLWDSISQIDCAPLLKKC